MPGWSAVLCLVVGILGFGSGATAAVSGTGFFITTNGYVVSNYHVIQGAKDIKVKDASAVIWNAEVAFTDIANDLAILKVVGAGFKALSIRSSSEILKGATVFTIGFPNTGIQGQEPKVTQGIVSSLSGIAGEPNSFQISVPVQPGNSGGPLLDSTGAVVGVVSAKLNASAVLKATGTLPENVNYAIKSNYLVELANTSKLVADNLSKAASRNPLPLPAIVAQAEKSVVLILANSRSNDQEKPAIPTVRRSTEWKSLVGTNTRRLIISDDTISGENHLPPDQVKDGGYARWDLRKVGDIWKGKYYEGRPCLTILRSGPNPVGIKRC